MFLEIVLVLNVLTIVYGKVSDTAFYDSFKGVELSREEYVQQVEANTTFWCVNEVETCDPDEWRRIDGSCNNLNHPNRGMQHTPTIRLLPASYSRNSEEGFYLRKSKSGEALPPERPLRTSLLPEGRAPDLVFTHLISHYLLFLVSDILNIHDTVNYVLWKPYCCEPQGRQDPECIPVNIPNDDPVHRFGHIRCMKLTRPLTFQSVGCLKNNTAPERVITPTPTIDLSKLYGASVQVLAEKGRLFHGGLLKYEIEDGRIWPPSTKTKYDLCILNQKPVETRCHDTPEAITNSLIGINLFSIWFWRLHNYIANGLASINPCWDDDKLFFTARDINIAIMAQVLYYELLPSLMGSENLLEYGVISQYAGYRDPYNDQVLPQISAEYAYILRWFHLIQETDQKMFDQNGFYLNSVPLTNITLRTGFLAIDDNLDKITQGAFRQAGARFDNLVDPDLAEIGLGPMTEATDIPTFDLVKNRHFGLAPYAKYLEICNGRPFNTFDDLIGFTKPEMLSVLKDKYKDVEDIDLMVGLWVELPADGSYLPKTLQCLMIDQQVRFLKSDRHWYERKDRPHAFSLEQLHEIRKSTMSGILCNVGDKVTEIQPNSFLNAGPGNEMTSCKNIPNIDFRAWTDPSCCRSYAS